MNVAVKINRERERKKMKREREDSQSTIDTYQSKMLFIIEKWGNYMVREEKKFLLRKIHAHLSEKRKTRRGEEINVRIKSEAVSNSNNNRKLIKWEIRLSIKLYTFALDTFNEILSISVNFWHLALIFREKKWWKMNGKIKNEWLEIQPTEHLKKKI